MFFHLGFFFQIYDYNLISIKLIDYLTVKDLINENLLLDVFFNKIVLGFKILVKKGSTKVLYFDVNYLIRF